jgi:ACT domain-containing protein
MKIKLKGDLDSELIAIGLKPGDIIEATADPVSKVGAMHFDVHHHSTKYSCVVWPVNYQIVTGKEYRMQLIERGLKMPVTRVEVEHFLKHNPIENYDIEPPEEFFQRVIVERKFGQRKTVIK